MGDHHVAVGILLVAASVAYFGQRYARAGKQRRLPWWGWLGLAIVLVSELLLLFRLPFVTTFFTAIVWTGYVLLVDSAVLSLEGWSRLSASPGHFLALAFWSVPLWLIFEAYNLRLRNWDYVGLPPRLWVQAIGFVWAFATIWPAIFETADLIRALGFFSARKRLRPPLPRSVWATLLVLGAVLVAAPTLVPASWGQYLFGAVWLGFIPLLDTLNHWWGGRSLLATWEAGDHVLVCSFLASGAVCGILWEFWNYWASARWVYVFPILQHWKIFEMPFLGFLGFPPFALECFVMYEFLRTLRRGLRCGTDHEQIGAVTVSR